MKFLSAVAANISLLKQIQKINISKQITKFLKIVH